MPILWLKTSLQVPLDLGLGSCAILLSARDLHLRPSGTACAASIPTGPLGRFATSTQLSSAARCTTGGAHVDSSTDVKTAWTSASCVPVLLASSIFFVSFRVGFCSKDRPDLAVQPSLFKQQHTIGLPVTGTVSGRHVPRARPVAAVGLCGSADRWTGSRKDR